MPFVETHWGKPKPAPEGMRIEDGLQIKVSGAILVFSYHDIVDVTVHDDTASIALRGDTAPVHIKYTSNEMAQDAHQDILAAIDLWRSQEQ